MDKNKLFILYERAYAQFCGSMPCLEINCGLCETPDIPTILLPQEKELIERKSGKKLYTFDYATPYGKLKMLKCPISAGICEIHKFKPLDCASYPIYVLYSRGKLTAYLDNDCPLAQKLSADYVSGALNAWRIVLPALSINYLKRLSYYIQQNANTNNSIKIETMGLCDKHE